MIAPAESCTFACPVCRESLARAGDDELRCDADGLRFTRRDGIWRFVPDARAAVFRQFIGDYEQVRRAEGRGSDAADYYLRLPYADRSRRFTRDWRIRARSFDALVARVLEPLESAHARPLRVLDLGAGNAWLAHRLAGRGHRAVAVDLMVNEFDGLGAHVRHRADVRYPGAGDVLPLESEFDRLPFTPGQFDLAVFNGSLHYSVDVAATLLEALRVLHPDAPVVIMDTPVYRDGTSGRRMLEERAAGFEQRYGFRSDALPSEGYLTRERLHALAAVLDVEWQVLEPFYGVSWALRPYVARALGRREPARFLLLVGRRAQVVA